MAPRKRPKRPRVAQSPNPTKTPTATLNPEAYRDLPPSWRLSRLEMAGPFGWGRISRDELEQVLEQLRTFEGMKWTEILYQGGPRHKMIRTASICRRAQQRLDEIGEGELDQLVEFGLGGRARIWGFLRQGALHLLWWDPDHQVCPSNKN